MALERSEFAQFQIGRLQLSQAVFWALIVTTIGKISMAQLSHRTS